jgi:hypothetical protein
MNFVDQIIICASVRKSEWTAHLTVPACNSFVSRVDLRLALKVNVVAKITHRHTHTLYYNSFQFTVGMFYNLSNVAMLLPCHAFDFIVTIAKEYILFHETKQKKKFSMLMMCCIVWNKWMECVGVVKIIVIHNEHWQMVINHYKMNCCSNLKSSLIHCHMQSINNLPVSKLWLHLFH